MKELGEKVILTHHWPGGEGWVEMAFDVKDAFTTADPPETKRSALKQVAEHFKITEEEAEERYDIWVVPRHGQGHGKVLAQPKSG